MQDPLNDYNALKELGEGVSSKIVLGRNKRTNALMALKIINKEVLTDQQENQVNQDIRIHFRLSHPNIVQCLQSFKESKEVLIVLEYVRKDLLVGRSLQITLFILLLIGF